MSIKRINNELKRIENYLLINNLNISFENDNERRVVSIFENDKLIMDIHIPNVYPFKPYNINLIKQLKQNIVAMTLFLEDSDFDEGYFRALDSIGVKYSLICRDEKKLEL